MLNFIRNLFKRRSFAATRIDRTTADWVISTVRTNEDIRANLATLVTRSRDLAKNNSHYRKWLSMRAKNVIGEHGLILRCKSRNADLTQDVIANNVIQRSFSEWGQFQGGGVSIDGLHSWDSFCILADRIRAVDGECFIQIIRGNVNKWGLTLKIIDSTLIDTRRNQDATTTSNEIVMGIERDKHGKPLAYHIKQSEYLNQNAYIRVPAADIIHLYQPEFAGQARGFPKGCSAILDMNMSAGYKEAELIAARVAACNMGVWERPPNATGKLSFSDTGTEEKAAVDMEPGKFTVAPRGWQLKSLTPSHPGTNSAGFLKLIDRAMANGLDVSYADLANDLEAVNFSSMRDGKLSERDGWKIEQAFMIERFASVIYWHWLRQSLLMGVIQIKGQPLPMAKLWKFEEHIFIPRRWDWVDPLKDIKADVEAVDNLLKAPQDIIRDNGGDPEETLEQIKEWHDKVKAAGLEVDKKANNGGVIDEQEQTDAEDGRQ